MNNNGDNILPFKLINGGANKPTDSQIFTDGMLYGQYLLIAQLIEEFELNDLLHRSRELFQYFTIGVKDKPVDLDKDLKEKILLIKNTFGKKNRG